MWDCFVSLWVLSLVKSFNLFGYFFFFSSFSILQQKQPSPADDASKAKYMDVARRLEEGLFKIANTKVSFFFFQKFMS